MRFFKAQFGLQSEKTHVPRAAVGTTLEAA